MKKNTSLPLPVLTVVNQHQSPCLQGSQSTVHVVPDSFSLMIKPVGAMCNLRCSYCYYMPTMEQFGGHEHRMSETTLQQLFARAIPKLGPQTTIAWQGGEPTLTGLAFFKTAIKLQQQYALPGQVIHNALQTNGTLLTPEWCTFLHDEKFLVGISIDGPDRMHDHYRVNTKGTGSSRDVNRALSLLTQHHVEHNVLCVLNDRNIKQPVELLGYFVKRGIRWLQFIPAVEWQSQSINDEPVLASFTPNGEDYGRFLCKLFDHWFDKYRHQVSIRLFDAILEKLVLQREGLCILSKSCHGQITIEHDGSVFGCDHFVEPRWRLGQVNDKSWLERLDWNRAYEFGQRKQFLANDCLGCEWRNFCSGGCPKHRPHRGDAASPSILCSGYKMFFSHAFERFQWLASYLIRNMQPPMQMTPR